MRDEVAAARTRARPQRRGALRPSTCGAAGARANWACPGAPRPGQQSPVICTVRESADHFSYRRDGTTGRTRRLCVAGPPAVREPSMT